MSSANGGGREGRAAPAGAAPNEKAEGMESKDANTQGVGAASDCGANAPDEPIVLEAELVDAPADDARAAHAGATASATADESAGARMDAKRMAEAFGKVVDVADKAVTFAPLPPAVKAAAKRVMPFAKKAAMVAPMVAPVVEPYARKAAAAAKEKVPEVAAAARRGAQTVGKAAAKGAKVAGAATAEGAKVAGRAAARGVRAAGGIASDGAKAAGHAAVSGAKKAAPIVSEGAHAAGRAAVAGAKLAGHAASAGVRTAGRAAGMAGAAASSIAQSIRQRGKGDADDAGETIAREPTAADPVSSGASAPSPDTSSSTPPTGNSF